MAMKDGIFLFNTHHVETDSFLSYDKQAPIIGFHNFGSEGQSVYTFEEVEDMLKNGFIDNNIKRDNDGSLYLQESYCSYCSTFYIVCGKILSEVQDKYRNIEMYCKNIGLIHDNFIPIKGWFGTKTMKDNKNSTYDIYYKFNEFSENKNVEFAKKICIGAMNRLRYTTEKVYIDGEYIEKPKLECKEINFNENEKVLELIGVPLLYAGRRQLHNTIISLDLELWILFNDNKYWSRFYNASVMAVRDMGQQHWFDGTAKTVEKLNTFGRDKNSNYDWYEPIK